MYLLDTDICVYALRHHPRVVREMAVRSPADIAVPCMVEAELHFGALRSRDPEKGRSEVAAFLAPLGRQPFDSVAAWHHAQVRDALSARPIGERDLVIASTALAHRATLVTHNVGEFGRVPGLSVEDWV